MIRYFVEAVRLGGFSRAGRHLGVTPASVSRQVAQLEDDLGVRLVNRTTRQMSLTEAGEMFYARMAKVIEEIADVDEEIRSLRSGPSGLLRITAPASFGRLHVAPWLGGFLEAFPNVRLDLLFTDQLVQMLDEKMDVAIRITAASDTNIIGRRLARQNSIACVAPAYTSRRGVPQSIEELRSHNCLTYGRTAASVWRFYRGEAEVGRIEVSGNIHSRDGDSIYVATLAGVGVSIQPIWRVSEDIAAGRLVALFPSHWVSSIGATAIYAYYPHRQHLAPKIRVFIDFLLRTFGSPPYWEKALAGVLDHGVDAHNPNRSCSQYVV
jgi:DNA-binding transcriptional LysR family regulator